MSRLLQHDITLELKEHRYTDGSGKEYKSVSKVLDSVQDKFNAKMISRKMAESSAKLEGVENEEEITIRQDTILEGWEKTRDEASDFGTMVHGVIEKYLKTGEKESGFEMMLDRMQLEIFGTYNKGFAEQIIQSYFYDVAGTADYVGYNGRGVLDIWDWKTNLSKGIEYYSKKGKFLKDPVGHLSDCNYNRYCLQLSTYGQILRQEWRYKVRKLSIVFIPAECPQDFVIIPVPFLMTDSTAVLEHYSELRKKEMFEPDPKLETL